MKQVIQNLRTRLIRSGFIILIFATVFSASAISIALGPYSGTVVDAQTASPVEGATVFIYWVKMVPQPVNVKGVTFKIASQEMIGPALVYTNKKGKYEIPAIMSNAGFADKLESTAVVIYQPGYQAYIKRIWHDSPTTKRDPEFAETNNTVKLGRIPPNFDHNRHYEEIVGALSGLQEYRTSISGSENAVINDAEWKKMVAFDKKVLPYKRELLRRAEWEERRGAEERDDR